MKKHSKRILIALLAAVMALGMTACSEEPADEPSPSEPESSVSEQASEPESSDPEAEEEPGSDAEAEAETETSEPAAEEPGSGADTGSSAASQPATDTTTSQPAANQGSTSSQAPAAQAQQPAANSQSQAPASQNQSQSTSTPPATTQTSNASSGKGPLANYTVSVQDNSTPAVSVSGRSIDGKSGYYFYSADDDILGYIASNVVSQINRDYKMIQKTDEEHKAWYVEQFNELRGLEGGSGSSGSHSSSSGSTGSGSSEINIDEYKDEVLRLVNEERENAGLPDLVPHSTAMEFAQIRAEEISELFSHQRPDGTFGVYSHYHFGENIAKGQETPQEVVDDWMSSNTHRSAIMDTVSNSNNTIGIGVYQDDGGILYWVLEFVTWDSEG